MQANPFGSILFFQMSKKPVVQKLTEGMLVRIYDNGMKKCKDLLW
jgi:hypothetical protein